MLEFIGFALFAILAGIVVRTVLEGRSARRASDYEQGGNVPIPCRVSWRQGLRRRAFVYGKLSSDAGGAVFKRPARRAVRLPVGGRAVRHVSWRPGMQVFDYQAPGGDELRLLVYEGDSRLVVRYLRISDSVDR